LLGSLADPQRDRVLVHQDLHGKNVLRARRRPWLAIDPKPVEFAVAPIVRSHELGHSQSAVLHRLSTLVDALGLDASRAWGWCFAQTVAWSISGDSVLPRHVEVARWLLAA
jgi:streptomycin 6-kinase